MKLCSPGMVAGTAGRLANGRCGAAICRSTGGGLVRWVVSNPRQVGLNGGDQQASTPERPGHHGALGRCG